MSLKVEETYYVVAHAYYHFIVECVAVLGVRRGAFKRVIQVQSSDLDWTEFFAKGILKVDGKWNTRFEIIGESPDMAYMFAHRWPHPIPSEK